MENNNYGNEGQSGRSSENENNQSHSGRGNESQSTGNHSSSPNENQADKDVQPRDSSFSKSGQQTDVNGGSERETLGNDDDTDSAPESGTR